MPNGELRLGAHVPYRYTATTQHRIRAVQTTSKDISFWRDCSALVTFCL